MIDRIRAIIVEHGRLALNGTTLTEGSDLYEAGLSSHATVNVMLALEEEFGVEFPDRMLRRATFQTIGSIHASLEQLESQPTRSVT